MIFSARELRTILADVATASPDVSVLADALAAAEGRAGAHGEEPAAIFFELMLRVPMLGPTAAVLAAHLARARAATLGVDLDLNDAELAMFRMRIAFGVLPWDQLRDAFAARLRPFGALPLPPPKRPR